MNRLVKAHLGLESKRKALGELLDLETRGEDYDGKLTEAKAGVVAAQGELEAAGMAEPEIPEHRQDTNQGGEIRGMLAKANVGAVYAAAFERRSTDGVEKELQDHYGISAHSIPLAMLETRAVTPGPTNTGATQEPIIQPIFAQGDAAYLAVAMPTVAAGDAVFPVLTARPAVGGPHTDSTAVEETTGAFTAEMLSPGRLQASFFYRRTDAARFAGMGEALREALSAGLSEALDKETIDQILVDVASVDATAADTFASYRKRMVYALIDGRFAASESDIRLLVGGATISDMAETYRSNNADDSAVDSLRRITGGLRVSPHLPAAAASKQGVIVRRGSRMDAVAPLWEGVTLIPDEVTKASTGEIVITAVLLAAFKTIRTDGFAHIQSQHA